MIRKLYFIVIACFVGNALAAQQITRLTLEQCYELAAKNSPLRQQKEWTIAAGNLAEKNVDLKWLPRLDINAQASYQSAVTSLPVKLPNITIEELDKDQYRTTLELVQPVYDGGVISNQKKLQQVTTAAEAQKVAIDIYQLRSTINAYFFTVLLMEQDLQLMSLVKQDLGNSLKTITAQVLNGIAVKSNEDLLRAELLKTDQQVIEFNAIKKQALENLAVLTGVSINEQTSLVQPPSSYDSADSILSRPELKLFDFQQQSIKVQSKLLQAKTNPSFSFFANGGYGKQGLNQLKNEFQWFYLTGVRLNIPLMSHITVHRDKAVLTMQEQVIKQQRANFIQRNQELIIRQKNEIEKFQQLMATDSAILILRASIKENALVKLTNGIITSDDYIRELNAESQARLNQKLHQVSMLQAQYNYKIILGHRSSL